MAQNYTATGAKSGNGPKCNPPPSNPIAKAGGASLTPKTPGPNPSSQTARPLKSGDKG